MTCSLGELSSEHFAINDLTMKDLLEVDAGEHLTTSMGDDSCFWQQYSSSASEDSIFHCVVIFDMQG